jgi:wobble nucleotide-excising tRNase
VIESISIATTATYSGPPAILTHLTKLNYLFGTNGTGKTTISRLIANEGAYPSCTLTWKGGTKLQTLVYNRDFLDRNFHQSKELNGVFTLGEEQSDALAKIEVAKEQLDGLEKKLQKLTLTLQGEDGNGGKRGELTSIEATLKAKCWAQKNRHDRAFSAAFEGYRSNAEKFKNKVLTEQASKPSGLLSLPDLEKKAVTVFGPSPSKVPILAVPNVSSLLVHESNPILKKHVVGKEDVDIAALIRRLGNSDWVQEGRAFFEVADPLCPFCQQPTQKAFSSSLAEYFDETFTNDTKTISDLATAYSTDAARLQQQLTTLISSASRFLDIEKLKLEKELLDSKLTINAQRIAEKKKESSRSLELDSLANVLAEIKQIVASANAQADEHNQMVDNLAEERRSLIGQVWRYVIDELKPALAAYAADKDKVDKAMANLKTQIITAEEGCRTKAAEIRALEKQTASIQPTIDGINALLSAFGFQSFKLAKSPAGSFYRIARSDGSDAKETLSEGEKTFMTFLYFYHLLKGSDSESGMTVDRVVVFDDPVSSLDSDILFIVSSLIKGLFDEVRAGKGHIKQIFVLTHNVYFHKEITFNAKRDKQQQTALKDETFWLVRKVGAVSTVEKHPSNPIKTSYELLWAEVRRTDRSNLTIQNTLRRILENYFKILGGIDSDVVCAKFEGRERLVCKALFSWVNDGSHFAHDDLYVSLDDTIVETYLRVFREIFRKLDHLPHYKMMMGDSYVEDAAPMAATQLAAMA